MTTIQLDGRIEHGWQHWGRSIRNLLPRGAPLPADVWRVRHAAIFGILCAHVPAVFLFGVISGYAVDHSLAETVLVAVFAVAASMEGFGRRFQSSATSVGLLTASGVLTHMSGGYIELHFHFFVMVAIIALYEDWTPFLIAIGYVVLHHGIMGTLDPAGVYNHADAIAHPWTWAGIHAGFILGASAAGVANWRLNELLRARSELILRSAGDGIVGLDNKGNIAFINPAASQMTGYESDELLGRNVDILIHGPGANGSRLPATDRAADDTSSEFFWRKDGSSFPVEYTRTPIQQESGVVGLVMTVKDITDRRRVENEIRLLNQELEQRVIDRTAELAAVNQELEAFSYSVSHDLRAPLRSMAGFSRVLMTHHTENLNEQGLNYLERIIAASQRMSALIDDLLNLSHVTRGEMRHEPVDLSVLAREIAAGLQETEPERRVAFIITDGLVTNGDRSLLRIVLENLLGNAWKFTANRPDARIAVGRRNDQGKDAFFVEDNGVGFDMAYADKLFQPFQRLHSPNEFQGTGIGLATVQRIIYRHGGRAWAKSSVGEGARFYFTC